MNLEEAKENIQPLASGRNIQRLETALNAEMDEARQAELRQERRQYEEAIQTYNGPDPLGPWYDYVLWVEQSYPKSGKQSALDEVIQKCLLTFEQDTRYNQDPRLVKLYIKYIDSQPNPTEHFQTLYNSGIGTMVADLYICWAYFYDVSDCFEKAESVYRKGKDARAEPADVLDLAHKQFGFSMSQRLLHNDDYRQVFMSTMEERRNALTSLHTQRSGQQVGSIRTGAAVRSYAPGRVEQQRPQQHTHKPSTSNAANAQHFSVFVENENDRRAAAAAIGADAPTTTTVGKSVVQTIMDSSRKQENLREAGPWSKADTKKSSSVFTKKIAPSFSIPEDMDLDTADDELEPISMTNDENMYAKPIKLPKNFRAQNDPPTPFPTLYFVPEPVTAKSIPEYDKCLLYPTPNRSYSIEELTAYRWFKKRNITNGFTQKQDSVWGNTPEVGIRLYPQFCAESDKDDEFVTKPFIGEDTIVKGKCDFVFNIARVYPPNGPERTFEDDLADKWKRGELVSQQLLVEETLIDTSNIMDETIPVVGRQSIFHGAIRKSINPAGRKSILKPETNSAVVRPSIFKGLQVTPKEDNDPVKTAPYTLEAKQLLYKSLASSNTAQAQPTPAIDPYKPAPFPFEPKPFEPSTVQEKTASSPDEHFIKKRVIFGGTTVADINPAQGAIRKSICMPAKRKNENAAKTEIPAKENCLDDILEQPEPPTSEAAAFSIFEDSAAAGGAQAVFKSPKPILHRRPFGVRPSPKETDEENAVLESDGGSQANETCGTTQQFMFFIKAQSVSTPKAIRHGNNAQLELSPTSEMFAKPATTTHASEVSSAQSDFISPPQQQQQPRQLSTIMETTESTVQTSSSSSERDSCSHSKTNSRPGLFSQKPLMHMPVKSDYHSTSMRPADIPTLCIDDEPTVTMPIFPNPSENFSLCNMPREPTIQSMCPIPTFQDETLAEIPPSNIHCDDTLPKISSIPSQNIAIDIYRDDTEQMPAIPKPSISGEKRALTVLSDRMPLKPVTHMGAEQAVPTVQPTPNVAIPPTNTISPENVSKLVNPFIPKHKLERTISQPNFAPDMSIPSISLLDDATTQQLPVVSFAKPTPIVSYNVHESYKKESNIAPAYDKPILISSPVTLNTEDKISLIEPIMNRIHINNADACNDEFLDMFTKTPVRHAQAKPFGSSTKKESSSRIPVPSTCVKNKAAQSLYQPNVVDKSRFELSSIYIKTEPLDSTSSYNQPASSHASLANKISFECDIDDLMSSPDVGNVAAGTSSYASVSSVPVSGNYSISAQKPPPEFDPNDYTTWEELMDAAPVGKNRYIAPPMDLNETRQVIESHLDNMYSDPFDENIRSAFLDQCDFVDYLKTVEVCSMVNTLRPIHPKQSVHIGNRAFDQPTLIGKGNYGHVFSAQCQTTGKMYALKQQRPANLWEYYICLEIESRIEDLPNMMNAFMTVECAQIGNNASILVSPFCKYGSLIDVCNKVRLTTSKNVAEPVVMMIAIQLLSIVDHLHACKIIHADIKPDNILLMNRLAYNHNEICVQLIDFGQAIDMQLYPDGQRFRSKLTTRNFVCTEMMEDKPWTYQTDLYCLAATIYTLLFGADMKVRKTATGYVPNVHIPRYYIKWMWESIFNTLINIKDCRSMPNLQSLRNMLLHELSNEKERNTKDAIQKFNHVLDMKK